MDTRRIGRGCFKVLIAGTLTLPMIPLATIHADPPRYRVTWLTNPSSPGPIAISAFNPNPNQVGTMGINNKTQVVYAYETEEDGPIHAWAWLRNADYNMTAGWHDLAGSSNDDSIARAISEYGFLAGQWGSLGNHHNGGCRALDAGIINHLGHLQHTRRLLQRFALQRRPRHRQPFHHPNHRRRLDQDAALHLQQRGQ